jgi:ABC-2 type transport system permease protein
VRILLALAGIFFWVGIFAVFYRVLVYFQSIEGFGDILAKKLLSMVLVTFFAVLIFSSILTALSTLYLSKDLPLVHAAPVPIEKIFLARWLESTFDSCWMVLLFGLPVFLAYGLVYYASLKFYVALACSLLPFCFLASGVGTLVVLVVVICLPANRMRDIFLLLSMVVVILLYFMFRFMRPERLVDPDALATLALYLNSLKAPGSPFIPTTWTLEALWPVLTGKGHMALFYLGLSASGAVSIIFLLAKVARLSYFRGVSKAHVAGQWRPGGGFALGKDWAWFLPIPGRARALLSKDVKSFFRDNTQWSQLFLMGALVVVYLYNFKVLPVDKAPIETFYLQNILSFLNMGLAGFVLAAIGVRFVFPAVSMEGQAFWVVRSAPISLKTFLWVKFWMYLGPLLILSETLIVLTNRLLSVSPFMMGLSTITVLFMVFGITAMGVGLGAAYPNFHLDNMGQVATGFGGMLFMILCMAFIGSVIVLEASPVYTIFMARLRGEAIPLAHWIWISFSFALVASINLMAIFWPMRLGFERLSEMET